MGTRNGFIALFAGCLILLSSIPVSTADALAVPTCGGFTATHVGTDADDVITGTPGRDVIVAKGGNDIVRGGGGNDVICGGSGNDELYGGSGKERIFGQGGKDRIYGGGGRDKAYGGASRDRIVGGGGNDLLKGQGGNDVLKGSRGTDTANGGSGTDKCQAETITNCENDPLPPNCDPSYPDGVHSATATGSELWRHYVQEFQGSRTRPARFRRQQERRRMRNLNPRGRLLV